MKTFFQHILSMGILVIALLCTVDSALGQNTTYEEIEYNSFDAPIMSLTLRQIMEGGQPHLIETLRKNIFGATEDNSDMADYTVTPPEEGSEAAIETSEEAVNPVDAETVTDGNAQDSTMAQEISSGDAMGVTDGDAAVSGGDAQVSGGDAAVSGGDAAGASGDVTAPVEEAVIPENDNYVMTSVPDTYFDDALFIGDSRTVGLSEYCEPLKAHATFYSKVSLTIYAFSKKEFVSVPIKVEGGADIPEDQLPKEKVTVEEALTRKQFAKIYIMLGLNELGSGTAESFTESYGAVVNRIRELQPDAIIIIQGIMHVTHSKSSNDRVFKNSTINERNAMLQTLADGEHVFYVDMNEATDDENGGLGHDLSFDNVHLKAKSYSLWYDYLKNHAFVKERDLEQTQLLLQQEIQEREAANAENPQ